MSRKHIAWLFILLILAILSYAYTIQGDKVIIENQYGRITVEPHTVNEFHKKQHAELCSKINQPRYINWSFIFDEKLLSGSLNVLTNISVTQNVYGVCQRPKYELACQYPNGTYYVCETGVEDYECVTGTEEVYKTVWKDKSKLFKHKKMGDKHVYYIENVLFNPLECKNITLEYTVPISKGTKKYSVYIQSNQYDVTLDPWYQANNLSITDFSSSDILNRTKTTMIIGFNNETMTVNGYTTKNVTLCSPYSNDFEMFNATTNEGNLNTTCFRDWNWRDPYESGKEHWNITSDGVLNITNDIDSPVQYGRNSTLSWIFTGMPNNDLDYCIKVKMNTSTNWAYDYESSGLFVGNRSDLDPKGYPNIGIRRQHHSGLFGSTGSNHNFYHIIMNSSPTGDNAEFSIYKAESCTNCYVMLCKVYNSGNPTYNARIGTETEVHDEANSTGKLMNVTSTDGGYENQTMPGLGVYGAKHNISSAPSYNGPTEFYFDYVKTNVYDTNSTLYSKLITISNFSKVTLEVFDNNSQGHTMDVYVRLMNWTTGLYATWTHIVENETVDFYAPYDRMQFRIDGNTTSETVSPYFTRMDFSFGDLLNPGWKLNKTNATATHPHREQNLQLNVTLTDNGELDNYIFSWNITGSWVNDTEVPIDGSLLTIIINKTIDVANHPNLVNWTVYFNDSSANQNQTDIFTFEVINTNPSDCTNVSISPAPAEASDDLTGHGNSSDLDSDAITTYYHRWYKNDIMVWNESGLSNSILGKGNISGDDRVIFSKVAYDGYLNGTWVNSSTMTIGDTTPPSIYYNATDKQDYYTDENVNITINCSDIGSDIGWVLVTYNKTSDTPDTRANTSTFTQGTGDQFYYATTWASGMYLITDAFCQDSSGNPTTNTINLPFSLSDRPSPTGGGGPGMMAVEPVNLSAIEAALVEEEEYRCGDGICSKKESYFSCPTDCVWNFGTMVCNPFNPKCNWGQAWFLNIITWTGGTLLLINILRAQDKKRRRR